MRVALLISLLALGCRSHAAFDVYLRVTPTPGAPIAGDVADPLYSGWINVLAFESGIGKPVAIGGPVGSTALTPITLVKTVDPGTAPFFEKLSAGISVATIKMVIVNRTPQRVEIWDMAAQNGHFTKQSFSCESGAEFTERITFVVGRLEWSYIQLSPAGDSLAEYFAFWNQINNTGGSGTRTPDFPGGLDTDGDGIPDGWESFYGLQFRVADSGLDTDGDGLDNLHEYIAHTHPRLPQSALRVTAFQSTGPGRFLLTWQSVAGLNYRIFTAPSPKEPFTFLKNVPSAGDGMTSTTVTGPAGQFFYRVVTP